MVISLVSAKYSCAGSCEVLVMLIPFSLEVLLLAIAEEIGECMTQHKKAMYHLLVDLSSIHQPVYDCLPVELAM